MSNSREHHQKPSRAATPARSLAFQILKEIRQHKVFLEQALAMRMKRVKLPAAEMAFARLLATEVVSHKGCLDELIDSVLKSPRDIDEDVRDALRISFDELFYLDKPAHVAVNEGVNLVRSVAPRAGGVANFALRRAVELKETFPFGNVDEDLSAACLAYGYPEWIGERLVEDFGYEAAVGFMRRSNEPAPLYFFVNQAIANGPQTLKSLVNQGVKIAPISRLEQARNGLSCFVFAQRNEIGDPLVIDLLEKGSLVISDGAAQFVATKAVPTRIPSRFLELGAGRGTKTILLQNVSLSRFGKQLVLDTLDIDQHRTKERISRLRQAGVHQDQVFCQDASDLSNFDDASYEAVFVDAPCSGLGTLRRHADIRWRLSASEITSLARKGAAMLEQAARLVAPEGVLSYATCTVFKEENESVITSFLESEEGARFEVVEQGLVHDLFDGPSTAPLFDAHFLCVLRKR